MLGGLWFDSIGSLRHVWDVLTTFVAQTEWLPWAFVAFLLTLTLWAGMRLRAGVSALVKRLNSYRQQIEQASDARRFTANFEEVAERLRTDKVLGARWREFEGTLLKPADISGVIRATSRPSTFFNETLIERSEFNLSLYQALPNYLVGLGLLFTFFGLVAALTFASKGVSSNDVSQAQDALKALLQAASFKFITSIAGLGLSIAFSAWKKRRLHAAANAIRELCRVLEMRLPQASALGLAEDMHQTGLKQLEQLERFNHDLATSIAVALDQRMSTTFERALAPIAAAIGDMSSRVGRMNEDALSRMIDDVTGRLGGAVQNQVDSVVGNLKEVQQGLTGLVSDVSMLGGTVQRRMTEATDVLKAEIESAAGNIRSEIETAGGTLAASLRESAASLSGEIDTSVQRLAASIEPVVARIESAATALGTLGAQVSSQVENLERLDSTTRATTDGLAAIVSRFDEAAASLDKTSATLHEGLGALERFERTSRELQESLRSLATEVGSAASDFGATSKALKDRFEGLDAELSAVFENLQRGLSGYQASVSTYTEKFDAQMAKAVNSLGAAIQELQSAVEELPAARQVAA
jgi:CII-binding regulator of phage lambda lysogenization HflD